MKKADLLDWVKSHGCVIQPLQEHKAKVLYLINPKTGSKAFIDLPIEDKTLEDYTVCLICCRLGIPVPDYASYMKPLRDKIEKENKEGKGEG